MSLVNDMLRDLDARRDRLSVDSSLIGLNPAPTNIGQPAYVHWLLVPLLAAIVGVLAWFMISAYLSKPVVPEQYMRTQPSEPESIIAHAEVIPEPVKEQPPAEMQPAPVIDATAIDTASVVKETKVPKAAPAPIEEKIVEPAIPPAPVITKTPRTLSPAEQGEQLYADALTAFRSGDMRRTETLLTDALKLSPDHIRAREQLAQLLIMQQRQGDAEAVLRAGLAIDPGQVNQAMLLGQLLAQQGREQEAIAVMEPALLNAADNAQFLGTLAGVYQNAGQPQRAVDNYRAALSLRPRQGIWWMGLGISLEQSGQYVPAIEAYQRALSVMPLPNKLRDYVEKRLAALKSTAESKS